jgi:hypothetical protein
MKRVAFRIQYLFIIYLNVRSIFILYIYILDNMIVCRINMMSESMFVF